MKKLLLAAMPFFFVGLISGAVTITGGPAWSQSSAVWQPLAEEIARIIDEAETGYKAGNVKMARRAVDKAYFGVFESRKMEAAMRVTLGARHTYLVEKRFGELRKAIKNGAGAERINRIAEGIRMAVRRDAKALDEAGVPAEVFEVNK